MSVPNTAALTGFVCREQIATPKINTDFTQSSEESKRKNWAVANCSSTLRFDAF
jgi:hypothetical protein